MVNGEAADSSIVLTRKQLYELVWSEPRLQLAKRLGISDVALAKRCRKLKIPMPGLGYWSKIQAGKRLPRPRLPQFANPGVEEFPGPRAYKAENSRIRANLPTRSWPDDAFAVPESLRRAHSVVRATREALERLSPDKYGRIGVDDEKLLHVNVSRTNVQRALAILEAIIRCIVKLGGRSVHGSGWRSGAALRIDEIDIHLSIEEPARNVPRRLTKEELEMHRRLPALYPRGVAYDSRPTGRLILRIDEGQVEDVQRSWSDGKSRRLEGVIREIVETILVTAIQKKERLAAEAEERRHKEEAERRRQQEEEKRREEQRRVWSLIREARHWQLSKAIYSYVDAVERAVAPKTANTSDTRPLRTWIEWARAQARKLDPVAKAVQ